MTERSRQEDKLVPIGALVAGMALGLTIRHLRKRRDQEFDIGLIPSDGKDPEIPTGIKETPRYGLSNDELSEQLLLEGRPFIAAGLSLIGDRGASTITTAILQFSDIKGSDEGKNVKGWNIHIGPPARKSGRLCYVDTANNLLTTLALPNTMLYFISEVDVDLVEKDVDQNKLQAVTNYALAQVHD